VERSARRIGVPEPGRWIERLNTDATCYGGGGSGNMGGVMAEPVAASGRPHSLSLTLPPLSTLIFELERTD
jgi:1,4-alpha-glucan branching enzyme